MTELTQTRYAYGEALVAVGEAHPEVVVLDADLYKSTRTVLFRDRFPERFVDMGIAEMDLVSTAAGMASQGLVPYANSFAMFITAHCYDQIRIQICYPNLHVILAGSSAGLTQGPDGASHQSLEDIALMRILPNMQVLVPADAVETRAMTQAVATEVDGPVYLRLGRYPVPDLFDSSYRFELGKAKLLREGPDVTLIACGHMVNVALQAAELLSHRQVQATVLNMSTIKPLDVEAVYRAMANTPLVVTVEEHSIIGGLGSAVAEVMAEDGAGARLMRMGTRDVFGESALADELLAKHGLTAQAMADTLSHEFGR
ncbi:MAG: transketolase family protein [Anaerolineae bacterium]|nr:transketolase family protein [Anaerolineae bacterium]